MPVVYDSVGKDTFYKSLDCLAPLGLMASFGQSSGAIGPVDIGILAAKGSLFLTRPTLNTYTASRQDLLTAANDLFDVVKKGAVKLADQPDLSVARRGAGAPRPAGPQDDGLHRIYRIDQIINASGRAAVCHAPASCAPRDLAARISGSCPGQARGPAEDWTRSARPWATRRV